MGGRRQQCGRLVVKVFPPPFSRGPCLLTARRRKATQGKAAWLEYLQTADCTSCKQAHTHHTSPKPSLPPPTHPSTHTHRHMSYTHPILLQLIHTHTHEPHSWVYPPPTYPWTPP